MHTKGPWILIEGGPLEGDTVITTQARISGDIIPIVDMDTDYEGEIGIEQEANARLIASAPELLEALRPFANFACDLPCDCHNCRARAAIAKVTGR